MKSTHYSPGLAMLLLWLIAAALPATAQPADGWFTYPTDGATGVSITPAITIRTNYRIDPTSVTFEIPYDPDSNDVGSVFPTVILMDSSLRSVISDSLFGGVDVEGEYELVDDSTLIFYPLRLLYNTTYSLRLKSLRVLVPQPGMPDLIVAVPEETIVFTTGPAPPKTVTASVLPGGVVRCSDVLSVTFSTPLASATTSGGNIIELYEEIRDVTVPISTTGFERVAVPNQSYWLNSSNAAEVQGTASLNPGGHYVMAVYGERLTGDPNDNHEIPFSVRDVYKVTINAQRLDSAGNQVDDPVLAEGIYPGLGSYYLDYGATVHPLASPRVEGYEFSHWRCSGMPALNGATTPMVELTSDCDGVQAIELTAVYTPIPIEMISVSVSAEGGGTVEVYDSENNRLEGIEGLYPVRRGDFITLIAKPYPGMSFGAFISNYPKHNGSRFPIAVIENQTGWTPDYDIEAAFVVTAPTDACAFIAQMVTISNPTVAPNTVASMTPCSATDPTGYESFTITTGPCNPFPVGAVQVNVTNSAWEIATVTTLSYVGGSWISMSQIVNGPAAMASVIETRPHTYVTFTLRPIQRKLIVEKDLDGGGATNDVLKKIWVDVNKAGTTFPMIQISNQAARTEFVFDEGTQISLTAIATGGFRFKEWASGAPYTDGAGGMEFFNLSLSGYNRHVKAIYHDAFVVTSIGIHDDPNNISTLHWYDPKDFQYMQNLRILPDGPFLKAGTKIYLRFNKSVNTSSGSFFVGGVPRINAFDVSERIDGLVRQRYDASNVTTGNTRWRPYNGVPNSEVELRLESSTGTFISKAEVFTIAVLEDLRSTGGLVIGNPDRWTAITECPGMRVTFKRLKLDKVRGDAGDNLAKPDPYTSFVSGHSRNHTVSEALVRQGREPAGEATKLAADTWRDYNVIILDVQKLEWESTVRWTLVTYDNDKNDFLDAVTTFLDALAQGLKDMNLNVSASVTVEKVAEFKVSANWSALPAAVISGISQVAKKGKREDDKLGSHEWIGRFSNLWGLRDNHEVDGGDATYKIEVVLDP